MFSGLREHLREPSTAAGIEPLVLSLPVIVKCLRHREHPVVEAIGIIVFMYPGGYVRYFTLYQPSAFCFGNEFYKEDDPVGVRYALVADKIAERIGHRFLHFISGAAILINSTG